MHITSCHICLMQNVLEQKDFHALIIGRRDSDRSQNCKMERTL
jgi:hypothetical protein